MSKRCLSRLPDVPNRGHVYTGLSGTAEHHYAPTTCDQTTTCSDAGRFFFGVFVNFSQIILGEGHWFARLRQTHDFPRVPARFKTGKVDGAQSRGTMRSMPALKGKIAVVTGSGSGIGRAIALCFSQEGAVVFVADRDLHAATAVEAEITAQGGRATAVCVDVSDVASCDEICGRIAGNGGRCDVLVNNAGVGHVGTVLTTSPGDLQRMIAVNVLGVLQMTQRLLPGMIARQTGSVINIASIGGVVGIKDRFGYCATKFAVVGMTKCMALDHAKTGVRFNAICPARVSTPFVTKRIAEYADPAAAYREMTESQPVGRMGTPEEIAKAALYFAGDDSAFVTGSSFIIDGAYSAG